MEKVLTVHSYDNYSKTIVITKYGVLLIIVLKLYSYIDSEVGNLRQFNFLQVLYTVWMKILTNK